MSRIIIEENKMQKIWFIHRKTEDEMKDISLIIIELEHSNDRWQDIQ